MLGIFIPSSHLNGVMSETPPSFPVRIQLSPEEMTFESIKQAIYHQAGALQQAHKPFSYLRLGKELYEILNRRLVFRTPAHKELPYFITPFGNLRVKHVHEDEIPDDVFVIE